MSVFLIFVGLQKLLQTPGGLCFLSRSHRRPQVTGRLAPGPGVRRDCVARIDNSSKVVGTHRHRVVGRTHAPASASSQRSRCRRPQVLATGPRPPSPSVLMLPTTKRAAAQPATMCVHTLTWLTWMPKRTIRRTPITALHAPSTPPEALHAHALYTLSERSGPPLSWAGVPPCSWRTLQ